MVLHSTRWLALSYFTYFFSYGIFLPFWSLKASALRQKPLVYYSAQGLLPVSWAACCWHRALPILPDWSLRCGS